MANSHCITIEGKASKENSHWPAILLFSRKTGNFGTNICNFSGGQLYAPQVVLMNALIKFRNLLFARFHNVLRAIDGFVLHYLAIAVNDMKRINYLLKTYQLRGGGHG